MHQALHIKATGLALAGLLIALLLAQTGSVPYRHETEAKIYSPS